jgi:pyruvate formate lyase activating enzyme
MSERISKREFLKKLGTMGGLFFACSAADMFAGDDKPWRWSHEAMFYTVTPNGVRCGLCPNRCLLAEGVAGTCRNRVNYNGKLFSIAYGNPCAVHVDPIEKKPLYHFLPNSKAYSIATAGCNFGCLNCLNWEISQTSPRNTRNYDLMPEEVVSECLKNNCEAIAYTYTEPVTFYEYVYETARIAKSKGIKNVFISNGYINPEPLKKLIPYLDAANINLKSFKDDIYEKLNGGHLQPILNTITALKDNNVWLEVTNLVIPGWTDDYDMIREMCHWLVANGFDDYPLHFNRFFPKYKLLETHPTPVPTLVRAKQIAHEAGMKYVYLGNNPEGSDNTLCPKCKKTLVERMGFSTNAVNIDHGKCKFCGEKINGVW